MNIYVVLLVAYSALLVGVGLALGRLVKTAGDFFVAGRRLGGGLIFTTFLAANIGAGSTVGAAGLGYQLGLSAWWWVGSAGIGSLLLAFTVGPRIYRIARDHNLFTLGDWLERRYSRAVRALAGACLWIASLTILAGQLIAMAWILNVVAGLPKAWGCLLGGLVVTIYFAAGGLFSSAWVNLIQLTVKMVGFLISVPWALSAIGGWQSLHTRVPFHLPSATTADSYFSIAGIGAAGVLGYVSILVPSFIISPGLIQKLYGARDERAVRWGIGVQGVVLLLYSFLPVVLGMTALAMLPGLPNRELALPTALVELLPRWLGALLLAAVFSAEISSADAVLFMLSTSMARDWYQTFLRPQATDRQLLRATRVAAVLSGAAGILAAIALPSVVSALTIFYSLLAVTLFVPVVAGLYSRRPGASAALVCMVVSIATLLLTRSALWGILAGAVAQTFLSARPSLFQK